MFDSGRGGSVLTGIIVVDSLFPSRNVDGGRVCRSGAGNGGNDGKAKEGSIEMVCVCYHAIPCVQHAPPATR